MKLNRAIMILTIVISFLIPIQTFAEESPLSPLDVISDQALQLTKAGRYEEAKQLLDIFSKELTEAQATNSSVFSVDEFRIITVAHNQALKAIQDNAVHHAQKINDVTTFRLVMDAMSSQYQPLWAEMKDPIMTTFQGLKQAAETGDPEAFHEKLNNFLTKYSMIQPSIKLDLPVTRVQQLDTRVSYIDRYRHDVIQSSEAFQELSLLETDLENLFNGTTEDEADPSLWWVIISTGSIIVVTLSYVGWRKYKGERESLTERQKH